MRRLSTAPMPCRSNIRNRGSAKYLVSTLSRGGALSPLDSIPRDKTFQRRSLRPPRTRSRLETIPPSVRLAEFSQPTPSGQSPYAKWLHWKLHDTKRLQSLCSWVAVHKCDTLADHRHGPWVTTQHNPYKSHFHPGVSFTSVVFLSPKYLEFFHTIITWIPTHEYYSKSKHSNHTMAPDLGKSYHFLFYMGYKA